MPNVLPTGYYHTNFCTLLAFVQERYHDLLAPTECAFIDDFHDLTLDAQRLYVRLLTRKGPLYRSDRLSYHEIADTDAMLDELSGADFVIPLAFHQDGKRRIEDLRTMTVQNVDTDIGVIENSDNDKLRDLKRTLLALLTRHELSSLLDANRATRKSELMDQAEQCTVTAIAAHLPARIVMATRLEEIVYFRLLFFGNTHQGLTEFVLRDLGLAPYETYTIDNASRFFSCRNHVEEVREAYAISDHGYNLLEQPDINRLVAFAADIPEKGSSQALRLYDRTRNQVARQLERMQAWDAALQIYRQSQRHPSRERQVRVLICLEQLDDAQRVVDGILANPWNEEELEFAHLSQHRIKRKQNQPSTVPARCEPRANDLTLKPEADVGVEELVRRHFEGYGCDAFYVENSLFTGLFGLLFWDVIFSHQPGVFFNEFQRGPFDLFSADFAHSRQSQIDECFGSLGTGDYTHRIRATFRGKFPVVNHFVHWGVLDEAILDLSLERIPADHLYSVFTRMLRDLRNNRSGFPDLVVFPPRSGYELIEVKGPGDALQKHQRRWFGHFQAANMPAQVIRLQYAS